MPYDGAPFPADDPLVDFVVPAHPDNVMRDRVTGEHKPINRPRGFVIHTPEERADNVEVTPRYFSQRIFDAQGRQRYASTTYYLSGGAGTSGDGDLYQMVPVRFGAIANGVNGKPYPRWADPNINLNYQTENVEVEGYAATIHLTCVRGGPQWTKLARLLANRSRAGGWPLDREHVIGHYQVATDRTDPGALDIDAIVADAQALIGQEEIMDVQWITAGEYGHAPTYLAFVTGGGQYRRHHIKDGVEENALRAAGIIGPLSSLKKVTTDQLKFFIEVP